MARNIVNFDLEPQRSASGAGCWGKKRGLGKSARATDMGAGLNAIKFDGEVLVGSTRLEYGLKHGKLPPIARFQQIRDAKISW